MAIEKYERYVTLPVGGITGGDPDAPPICGVLVEGSGDLVTSPATGGASVTMPVTAGSVIPISPSLISDTTTALPLVVLYGYGVLSFGNITGGSGAGATATAAKQDEQTVILTSLDTKIPYQGQSIMSRSIPMVIASDQSPVGVTGSELGIIAQFQAPPPYYKRYASIPVGGLDLTAVYPGKTCVKIETYGDGVLVTKPLGDPSTPVTDDSYYGWSWVMSASMIEDTTTALPLKVYWS